MGWGRLWNSHWGRVSLSLMSTPALACAGPPLTPAHSLPPGVLGSPLISLLFWILICFSIAALFTKRYSVRPLIVALILRSIYYLGIGPTLNILGALNVSALRPLCSPRGPSPLRLFHAPPAHRGPPGLRQKGAASRADRVLP